jgi:8-oxo-dGTP pyrophosphatase MutT (NUDIX family)
MYGHPLYACVVDVERQIDAAAEAGETALESVRVMPGSLDKADAASRLSRELREVSDDAAAVLHAEIIRVHDAEGWGYGALSKYFGVSKTRVQQIITKARENAASGVEPSTTPEPGAVVAAIVTSAQGVLIGRRNDGKPPWTFIAGKIEPGESPADAAVREVKEETGMQIRAGNVIGRRVHPRTGRPMVYMAARPTHGTDIFVGDEEELAEVRWVDLAEADELMGGQIFEPVRRHLRSMLKG